MITVQPRNTRTRTTRLLPFLFLILMTGSAWAEVCKGSRIPRAELPRLDAHVELSPAELDTALQAHLPWGQPACPRLLPQQEYILCYDPVNRITLWAAYKLKSEEVVSAERRDAFRTDPRLSVDENASCADYAGTGFARGHAVPREDMNRSAAAQADTFFLTNMTPQFPVFNGGIWARFERLVRDYARRYGEVYVITGSVLQEPLRRLPSDRVAIPSRFYKVLLRSHGSGTPEVLAIVLPHLPFQPGSDGTQGRPKAGSAVEAYLAFHTASIREIEHLTGLDLLPKLDEIGRAHV
jgi:DNA/RNA endonuclease G (NUC1)